MDLKQIKHDYKAMFHCEENKQWMFVIFGLLSALVFYSYPVFVVLNPIGVGLIYLMLKYKLHMWLLIYTLFGFVFVSKYIPDGVWWQLIWMCGIAGGLQLIILATTPKINIVIGDGRNK
jgi:hypothetical protein